MEVFQQFPSPKYCHMMEATKHAFSMAVPSLWNTLAPEVWQASVLLVFYKALKDLAFPPSIKVRRSHVRIDWLLFFLMV